MSRLVLMIAMVVKINFGTEQVPVWRYIQHRMKQ